MRMEVRVIQGRLTTWLCEGRVHNILKRFRLSNTFLIENHLMVSINILINISLLEFAF